MGSMTSNRYVHAKPGVAAQLIECLANSQTLAGVRRSIMGRLPFLKLSSDVTDVVYATWLVDAKRVQRLAPNKAVLWQEDGLTPLTILTYRHGHFGPQALGRFRKVFPSPLQSNWRLYLKQPLRDCPDVPTVVFLKNVLDSALYAVGSRVFSDALPSHWAAMALDTAASALTVDIDPGQGSAPALRLELTPGAGKVLPVPFTPLAQSWEDFVQRIAPQDAAVVDLPDIHRIALARIALPADLATVEPLVLRTCTCPWLMELGALPEAVCFKLPSVAFTALSERLIEAV